MRVFTAQLRRESEGFFRKPEGFKRRSGRLLTKKRKASYEKAEGFFRDGYIYILCIRTGCSRLHVQRRAMAVLSKYVKQRIVSLKEKGLTNREVVAALKRERVSAIQSITTQAVQCCYVKYIQTGSIERQRGSGRPTLRTKLVQGDDEATACQIRSYLLREGQRLLSLTTILRGQRQLGWTYRGSASCQLIRQANKEKRLEWARAHLQDDFENVLWTDETSVHLECHKRFLLSEERRATPPEALCKASCEGACVGWNRMAWRQRSLYFRWNDGCSEHSLKRME